MLKKEKLALFFTTGMSLEKWAAIGNISREVELYNELAKHFQEIYFVTYGIEENELSYQYMLRDNIVILSKKIFFLPDKIYTLMIPFLYADYLKRVTYIKTNQMQGSLSALIAKFVHRKKLIVRCGYEFFKLQSSKRSNFLRSMFIKWYEKLVYSHADKIILTSESDKVFVANKLGIRRDKIYVIQNYVNTDVFKPIELNKERGTICYVGRLNNNEKNLKNLILALSGMPEKLILIGAGEFENNLTVLGKKYNVNLHLVGSVANHKLPIELNKAEIFILPSFMEGCPKALLEAMSCGLPCIGTNVDGIKQIIRNNENGILCETDAKSMRGAMQKLLFNDGLRNRLGRRARETIVNGFSLHTVVKRELGIYNKCYE